MTESPREDPAPAPTAGTAASTPSDPNQTEYEDRLFGRILLEWNLVQPDQLQSCLQDVAEARSAGKQTLLGEILVERGHLAVGDIFRILKEQGRRTQSVPDVSRYSIQDRIGEGATSVVYRAWDRELRRVVALKVLRDSAGFSSVARERFRREARTTAGLSHPNVVTVHDGGESKGQFYLVMEYVEGKPLGALFGKTDRSTILELIEKAARGVGAAHAKGVVHRDLKPDNILVTAEGEPKVADFGLAHVADSTLALTREGATLGTPLYMSPEQVNGRSEDLTPRTDVFALGAILYEALAGVSPFLGTSLQEIYSRIVNEEPAPLRRLRPDVEPGLEAIVLKALSKDPRKRYEDATALAEDLRRHREGDLVQARAPTWTARTVRKVRRRAGTAVAGLAVLLAAALLWTWTGGRGPVSDSVPFLERIDGDVFVLSGADRRTGVVGQRLEPGQGLETGKYYSRVVVRFPDRSQLELGPATLLREISNPRDEAAGALLARGSLAARVAPVSKGGPWKLRVPQGSVETAEGVLKIAVGSGGELRTRVEGVSGAIRLGRPGDGNRIGLPPGHEAVLAREGPWVVGPIREGAVGAGWNTHIQGGWSLSGDPNQGPFEMVGHSRTDGWEWLYVGALQDFDVTRSPLRVRARFVCPAQDADGATKIGFGVRRTEDSPLPKEIRVEIVNERIVVGFETTQTKMNIGSVDVGAKAGSLMELEVVLDPIEIEVRVAGRQVYRTLHGFDGLTIVNPNLCGLSNKADRRYTTRVERLEVSGLTK